jgi:hypothetical protein
MGMNQKQMVQPGSGRHYDDKKQLARMLKGGGTSWCVTWNYILEHCNLEETCMFSEPFLFTVQSITHYIHEPLYPSSHVEPSD